MEPTATPQPRTAEEVAGAFLAAWASQDWQVMAPYVLRDVQPEVRLHRELWDALRIRQTAIEGAVTTVTGAVARTDFTVRAAPDGMDPWVYDSSLDLVETADGWAVDWTPQVIHPALSDGRSFARVDKTLDRGRILDRSGIALRAAREVRQIGVVPGRIEDLDGVVTALVDALDVDGDTVRAGVAAPGLDPSWFVPVATVDQDRFDEVWPDLRPLPGVVFQTVDDRQSSDPDLAAHLLGTVGPITAELLAKWGEPYTAGDVVGRSGLELAFEAQLRGRERSEIRVLDAAGNLLSVLESSGPLVPFDLQTTLDRKVQLAAEAAVAPIELPVALVALDVHTGEIRAAVSRPLNEFNRAISGLYPPGSTFKTITATAAIAAGETVDTILTCPATLVAAGYPIRNAGGMSLGEISMLTAYARSCNTAFAGLGLDLGATAVAAAAAGYGFDVPYTVGLDTAGGRFPDPVDDAEVAAASIGQGRVQASPLHMASVAAAVADGSWRQPVLVTSPDVALAEVHEPIPLPDGAAAALQEMMAAVVASGTGGAVRSVGVPVSGKTGSAEFGDDDPPKTHAWFIGFSGDLAFAVMVEGGGGGGSVAGPIAARFLVALGG